MTASIKDAINKFLEIFAGLWSMTTAEQDANDANNSIVTAIKDAFRPAKLAEMLNKWATDAIKSATESTGAEKLQSIQETLKGFVEGVQSIFEIECLTDTECEVLYGEAKPICDNA